MSPRVDCHKHTILHNTRREQHENPISLRPADLSRRSPASSPCVLLTCLLVAGRLATEELLREARRGGVRAELAGPMAWRPGTVPNTDKRFLANTLRHTLASNRVRDANRTLASSRAPGGSRDRRDGGRGSSSARRMDESYSGDRGQRRRSDDRGGGTREKQQRVEAGGEASSARERKGESRREGGGVGKVRDKGAGEAKRGRLGEGRSGREQRCSEVGRSSADRDSERGVERRSHKRSSNGN